MVDTPRLTIPLNDKERLRVYQAEVNWLLDEMDSAQERICEIRARIKIRQDRIAELKGIDE
ncbi:MAG: hypothetical protein ACXABD_18220 [Candidatus Thorarchaeota archaeon]|jgi:hypothetical protein